MKTRQRIDYSSNAPLAFSNAAKLAAECKKAEAKAVEKINNILTKNLKLGPKGDISGAVHDMVGTRFLSLEVVHEIMYKI